MNMSIRSACFIVCAVLAGAPAGATVYELPTDGGAVIGTDEHIKSTYQDTLLDIARRYSLGAIMATASFEVITGTTSNSITSLQFAIHSSSKDGSCVSIGW